MKAAGQKDVHHKLKLAKLFCLERFSQVGAWNPMLQLFVLKG